MAGGKGHLIGGFIFILVLLHTITHYFYRPSLLDLIMYIAIGLMFAVWPDVDIKSIGQKFFYTVFFLVDIYLVYNIFTQSIIRNIKSQPILVSLLFFQFWQNTGDGHIAYRRCFWYPPRFYYIRSIYQGALIFLVGRIMPVP